MSFRGKGGTTGACGLVASGYNYSDKEIGRRKTNLKRIWNDGAFGALIFCGVGPAPVADIGIIAIEDELTQVRAPQM